MAPRNDNSSGWFNLIVALSQVPRRDILPVRHNMAGITSNEHSSPNAGDHVNSGGNRIHRDNQCGEVDNYSWFPRNPMLGSVEIGSTVSYSCIRAGGEVHASNIEKEKRYH